MTPPYFDIDLTDLQSALNKVVREKVRQQTKDVPQYKRALESVYYDICNKIETWQANKELYVKDKLDLNALETEGYIRCLLHCKQSIEETLEAFKLEIPIT
jgi:hypothetical protein